MKQKNLPKKKLPLLAAVFALVLLLSACAGEASPSYQTITPEEGAKLMGEGGVTVVDVRSPDEYESGHVPGAVNIPNEEIGTAQPDGLPDLNAALIVYCQTGVRSKEAADKLAGIGYTDVKDMGGIVDWPYDTVTGSEPGTYVPAADGDDGDKNAGDEDGGDADTAQAGILSNFTATDLEGDPVDQSIFSDYDLTMINVWATYCGPCLGEMPDLGELADSYKEKGVQIVGLVSDALNRDGTISESQVETAKEIVDETGANYLHLLPSEDLMGILSQIYAVPTTFFVDKEGRQVGDTYMRAMKKDKWIDIIDKTLEEVRQ